MENNIHELIEGLKEPILTLYRLLTPLNYRIIGELLFMTVFVLSIYLFCYYWVYFCIRLEDNSVKKEKENKWISTK
jgi:preprotein translocase subunit SecY